MIVRSQWYCCDCKLKSKKQGRPANEAIHWFLQAFHKLDEIATHHTEKLRKLTKQVQEYRQSHDDEAVKRTVEEYDETLERYNRNSRVLLCLRPCI